MAWLTVRLLGPFQITLGEEPAAGFVSDKVRALFAYLAVGSEQPHRREKLAGLLWPDWTEGSARANLRRALANLRQVIGDHKATPPYLHISRQTLQFNTASNAWVDVTAFTGLLQSSGPSPETIRGLEQAAELYRGDFLEGFSVGDSPAFEEWVSLHREWLRRLFMQGLHRLAACHEQVGEYERGLRHAWRQAELDPLREKAHRQLMRLLALSGQRSAALAQYETCRRNLADELGVKPAAETTDLYEQLRSGRLQAPVPPPPSPPDRVPSLPFFLEEEAPCVEMPTFVARDRELARLDRFLDLALVGQGRVVFVTGEAGSGKTALVQEFARRAQEAHASPSTGSGQALVAASGNCNAYTGIGDPCLPFREILGQLTGDVQARWAAGAITTEHARRLWDTLPLTAQALVEAGPELIGTFLPPAALLARTVASMRRAGRPGWLARLDELVQASPLPQARGVANDLRIAGPQQSDLFEQYTGVLLALARQVPLILLVDDLQWADLGSISLLFHLGRQLAGSRILLVGTYRPEEVAVARDGKRHPLEAVIHEFQRNLGDIALNLDQAEHREFVEAFLNSEPNRLGRSFREMLYRQTRGHALFTVELLRGLQEQGALVRDAEGRWLEGPALAWETLPARVEAVIAERIGRLAEPLQAALRVASVEGEVFTAEVVARVRAADEGEVVQHLSGELDRGHRLVRAEGIQRMDGRRLSHYRFRHVLFQRYLYNGMDEVERAHLHEAVGRALELLYRAHTEEAATTAAIAPQLAWHFAEAGMVDKAIPYLRQAGERAMRLSAYEEGIAHLTKGLDLLAALPVPDSKNQRLEHARQELALQLALGAAWVGRQAYGPQGEEAYNRARALSQQLGETSQLCLVLGRLAIFHYVRTEHQEALELAEEALSLAQRAQDPLHVALGHRYLGAILLCLGEYKEARAHLAQMISFYQPQQHHRALVSLRGSDAGTSALAYDACCLWCLGYPEQAAKRSQEALTLARALGHPFSLADVLWYAGGMLGELRRDGKALMAYAKELKALSQKVPAWSGTETCFESEALLLLGQVQEGMAQLREAMAILESKGIRYFLPGRLLFLAEAQARAGQTEQGLDTLDQALAVVEETGERYWEAELRRQRGEWLLAQGEEAGADASLRQAESCFRHAIEVARRQSAKSWELRATTSLARLWQAQGRVDEAREALAEIYGWFTEGFDTADLREAKALLDALA